MTKYPHMWGHESDHHHAEYVHLDAVDTRGLNAEPNDCHGLQTWHGNTRYQYCQLNRLHGCDCCGRLVWRDNEGKGVRDLVESKHATSVGSSDAFHRVDHHYEGDENAHCGDDGGSRDDEEFHDDGAYYGRNDGGSRNGLLCHQRRALVHERVVEHVVEHVAYLHDRVYRSV